MPEIPGPKLAAVQKMPKFKGKKTKGKKERIKMGSRVRLMGVATSDGVITAKDPTRKAWWKVAWSSHPQNMDTTEQSSRSLALWALDLQQIESDSEDAAEEEMDDDEDDDDGEKEQEKTEAAVDYAGQKRKFDTHARTLEGKEVTVSLLLYSSYGRLSFIMYHQVLEKSMKTAITWRYKKRGSLTQDDFPDIEGPIGVKKKLQLKVFSGLQLTGKSGDKLRAWLHLYPGDISSDVRRISLDMKAKDPKAAELTVGEYVVWHGLFLAATLCLQRGRDLFDPPKKEQRFRKHPEFAEYMSRFRFEAIKASWLSAFADPASALTDRWWEIRPLVDRFNQNRRRTLTLSPVQVPDEAMSPFQPRTSPSADLPHLSFVERKPKKLGTEVKCVADGLHGVMRFLEIQEGKGEMAKKKYRDMYNAATAQALRLVEGVHGVNFLA